MTIESEADPDAIGGGRCHDHVQHRSQGRDAATAAGFSPFLASAFDRLAIAVVLAAIVWIGVAWAVR